MVMMTLHFTDQVPFKEVYVHGLIRDAEGQKMSKSKGNVLDPLDIVDGISLQALLDKRTTQLMDPRQTDKIIATTKKHYPDGIASFGTDALRFTFSSLASPGRDIKFDLQRCDGYRNFCNKLWNATRFVLMNCEQQDVGLNPNDQRTLSAPDEWILSRLNRTEALIADAFAEYRFDNLSRALYEFIWDEYCDWYLELAKVQLQNPDLNIQRGTRHTLVSVLESILRLAHPIIPFITEELWQTVSTLTPPHVQPSAQPVLRSLMLQPYPKADPKRINEAAESDTQTLKQLINACRSLRSEMNLAPGQKVPLLITGDAMHLARFAPYMAAMARLSEVKTVPALPQADAPVSIVGPFQLMLQVEIDKEAEKTRLQKEQNRLVAEVAKAQAKLINPQFVDKAPAAVVAQERTRLAQFEANLNEIQILLKKLHL
jgi:valyl-tRNA synthetase